MSATAIRIGDRMIGRTENTYIIAEIGQNHQGNIDHAKQMIAVAKKCGADCVKFQKSHLPAKFTAAALRRPYASPNAWADTYGDHKRHLEFSLEQYEELQRYAHEIGIAFTASAMDEVSLEQLCQLRVPFVKIGSGDGNNFPLLVKAAQHRLPLIVSTGMQKESTVRRVVEILKASGNRDVCLLHCVSAYPTHPEYATLRLLESYRKWFPDVCLGYSGHEQGIWISVTAVLLGANVSITFILIVYLQINWGINALQVIERHFTLDKRQKGTDHPLSLEPAELTALITTVRQIDEQLRIDPITDTSDSSILRVLGTLPGFNPQTDTDAIQLALKPIATKKILNCEMECSNKLGKSLVFRVGLSAGTVITENHLCAKVNEPRGISADQIYEFVGQELTQTAEEDDLVREICFKRNN